MTDSDQPESLVLRMLRTMDIKIDRVIAEQRAAKAHLLAMSETLLAVRKDIQNLDERLTRVETRLDLRDAARAQ
jgi:hypothetical protein